jgi:hypothetical protein
MSGGEANYEKNSENATTGPFFYHLLSFGGERSFESNCFQPHIQCIDHLGVMGKEQPGRFYFTYQTYLKEEELIPLLEKIEDPALRERVKTDLFTKNAINNPFGYLRLNPSGMPNKKYLIIKTTSSEEPFLQGLIPRVPYSTPTPHFFKKVGGSRRRTRSQKKRRRATRRRN